MISTYTFKFVDGELTVESGISNRANIWLQNDVKQSAVSSHLLLYFDGTFDRQTRIKILVAMRQFARKMGVEKMVFPKYRNDKV